MSRPRAFDETVVLEAAMDCFWEDGYEPTSIRELAQRMELTGASVYNAFGDKRGLFRRALEHYIDHNTCGRIAGFEQRYPPRQAIVAFLEDIVEQSLADERRRGCLLVNSALEVAPHDPEFGAEVARGLTLLETFFRRSAEAGQKDGSIAQNQTAGDLGRIMLGTLIGIRVLARSRPERALLEGVLRPALSLLGPSPHPVDLPKKGRTGIPAKAGVSKVARRKAGSGAAA